MRLFVFIDHSVLNCYSGRQSEVRLPEYKITEGGFNHYKADLKFRGLLNTNTTLTNLLTIDLYQLIVLASDAVTLALPS